MEWTKDLLLECTRYGKLVVPFRISYKGHHCYRVRRIEDKFKICRDEITIYKLPTFGPHKGIAQPGDLIFISQDRSCSLLATAADFKERVLGHD